MAGPTRPTSPLTGTFTAREHGLVCTLELRTDADGRLRGTLRVGALAFEIRGRASRSGHSAHGFALEAHGGEPVALLRVTAGRDAVTLDLDLHGSPPPGIPGPPTTRLALARSRAAPPAPHN